MITAAMLSTFNSEPCRDTLQAGQDAKKLLIFFLNVKVRFVPISSDARA
jgi:hypothetical protein